MASYNNPQPTNSILDDINTIRELSKYNAKLNPSLGTDMEEGMIRLVDVSGGKQIQRWNGSSWVNLTASKKLLNDVDTIDGRHVSTEAVKNTIPVYNKYAMLVGSITGNAATATKLATSIKIDVGGLASSTAQNFDGSGNITIPINRITVNNKTDTAVNGVLTALHGGTGREDGASLDVVVNSLSGIVKASEYGQIGRAQQITNSTDFNKLVVDGNYVGRATVSVKTNNAPAPYTNSGMHLRVSTNDNTIVQTLTVGGENVFSRISTNGGSSWGGWIPIGSTKPTVTLYVSESGVDTNTGYDSAYPVRTIDRAIQIAKGAVPRGANGYVKICIGSGSSWGTLNINNVPFALSITPSTGSKYDEYSSYLPVFEKINIKNSRVNISSLVIGTLVSTYNSSVYIDTGYKRMGRVYVDSGGIVVFESDNNTNNVLSVYNNNVNSPIFDIAYNSGVYVTGYLHVKIDENVSKPFLSISSTGVFSCYSSRLIFDDTDATVTGEKAKVYAGAMFNTNSAGSATLPTFLTSTLPGTKAPVIQNGAIINGIPYGVLHLSGGTMTGHIYADESLQSFDVGFPYNNAKGALIALRNINYSSNPGGFEIVARNASATQVLAGFVNGALTWGGKNVALLDTVYPVGSIYMSVNSTNPATLFGGKWEQIQGRFLLAASSAYGAGSTGGEATHTLTANEMPVHNHSAWTDSQGGHNHNRGNMEIYGQVQAHYNAAIAQNEASGCFFNPGWPGKNIDTGGGNSAGGLVFQASRNWTGVTNWTGAHGHNVGIGNTGSGEAHNNMPPYLSVYMWKRTA